MSEENLREAERVDVMKKIRNAEAVLRIAEDVNKQWGFIKEETFKQLNDALSKMHIEINVNAKVTL